MINSKIQNPGGLSGQGQFPGLIQNHTIGLFSYSKSISFPVIVVPDCGWKEVPVLEFLWLGFGI
jgi:hypothetical protein